MREGKGGGVGNFGGLGKDGRKRLSNIQCLLVKCNMLNIKYAIVKCNIVKIKCTVRCAMFNVDYVIVKFNIY